MPSWRHTQPYNYDFFTVVSDQHNGLTVLDFLSTRFAFFTREIWQNLIADGDVSVNGNTATADLILKTGDKTVTQRKSIIEPHVRDDYTILFDHNGLLALNKPAPLPVHPSGRYFKNTLTTILSEKFPDRPIHPIHRLDVWTTGVLLIATNTERAEFLHRQIEDRGMTKIYGVIAVGDFGKKPFVVDEAIGRKKGAARGTGADISQAKSSKTRFTPIAKNGELTLLKAEPLTGRTNQIRVHIQAAGGYILGDPLYSPTPISDENMSFMGLHCREMSFLIEPGRPFTVTAPWPEEFKSLFSQENLDNLAAP